MICSNCGKGLPDEARFCTKCGSRIERQSSIQNKEPVPYLYTNMPIISNADEGNEQSFFEQPIYQKMPPHFAWKNQYTCILIVIIIIIAVFTGLFAKISRSSNDNIEAQVAYEDSSKEDSIIDYTEDTYQEALKIEQPYEKEIAPELKNEICSRCGRNILADIKWEAPVATDEINAKMEAIGSTPLEYYNPAEHDYQLFVANVTWEEAEIRCEEMGGHLATIACKEEIEKIEGYLGEIGVDYRLHIWIGTKCYGQDLDGYCSLRGVVDGENLGISNWYPGEPTHYDPKTGVEELYLNMVYLPDIGSNGDWVWLDVPNDISGIYGDRIAYLCEWEHVLAE